MLHCLRIAIFFWVSSSSASATLVHVDGWQADVAASDAASVASSSTAGVRAARSGHTDKSTASTSVMPPDDPGLVFPNQFHANFSIVAHLVDRVRHSVGQPARLLADAQHTKRVRHRRYATT